MISVCGVTWTDEEETYELDDIFCGRFGPERARPACVRCTDRTCYIVEEIESGDPGSGLHPVRRGVGGIYNSCNLACFEHGGKIFFPVPLCIKCEARDDAKIAFGYGRFSTPNLDGLPMGESDKVSYRRIFQLKIGDLYEERQAQIAERQMKIINSTRR